MSDNSQETITQDSLLIDQAHIIIPIGSKYTFSMYYYHTKVQFNLLYADDG